jgi:hypothetical protein
MYSIENRGTFGAELIGAAGTCKGRRAAANERAVFVGRKFTKGELTGSVTRRQAPLKFVRKMSCFPAFL